MFVRIILSGKNYYLQIVEYFRQDSKVRQRVQAAFGRAEQLIAPSATAPRKTAALGGLPSKQG